MVFVRGDVDLLGRENKDLNRKTAACAEIQMRKDADLLGGPK